MQEPEVSAETSEEAVNAAAQEELAAAVQAPAEQVETTNVEKTVAAPASAQKTDPQKTAPTGQAAFDAQKSYEEVAKQLAETRKWATQQSQIRAQYEKELTTLKKSQEEMARKFAEATEAPFNLEQFNKDFVQNGFKAFDPYLEKKLSSVREAYEPKLQEQARTIETLQTNLEIIHRKTDTANYPDFASLEPKMVEILNSPNCPIDRNLPLSEKLDAVYQLAKTQSSTEAIKAAKVSGYNKAQADLAKEAKTAVATGGKGVSASPADLQTMPMDQLEKLVTKLYGVADRD